MTTPFALVLLLTNAALEPPPPSTAVPVAHTAGILGGMRLSVAIIWPDPYASASATQLGRAYTEPPLFRRDRALFESDGDPWTINVVGHALFGSEVYQRARGCGHGWLGALLFTTAASTFWEYGIESWNKRPSAIDLVSTPVLGLALGEARYQVGAWSRRRPSLGRRIARTLVDPFGEAERAWIGTSC